MEKSMKYSARAAMLFVFMALFTVASRAQEAPTLRQEPDQAVYVFVGSNNYYTWCNISDHDACLIRKKIHGLFLWYEERGNGYLLVNPAALSKLDQLSQERAKIYADDPERPKNPKRGDTYIPGEKISAKLQENATAFELLCKQEIRAGSAIPMSRQELLKSN